MDTSPVKGLEGPNNTAAFSTPLFEKPSKKHETTKHTAGSKQGANKAHKLSEPDENGLFQRLIDCDSPAAPVASPGPWKQALMVEERPAPSRSPSASRVFQILGKPIGKLQSSSVASAVQQDISQLKVDQDMLREKVQHLDQAYKSKLQEDTAAPAQQLAACQKKVNDFDAKISVLQAAVGEGGEVSQALAAVKAIGATLEAQLKECISRMDAVTADNNNIKKSHNKLQDDLVFYQHTASSMDLRAASNSQASTSGRSFVWDNHARMVARIDKDLDSLAGAAAKDTTVIKPPRNSSISAQLHKLGVKGMGVGTPITDAYNTAVALVMRTCRGLNAEQVVQDAEYHQPSDTLTIYHAPDAGRHVRERMVKTCRKREVTLSVHRALTAMERFVKRALQPTYAMLLSGMKAPLAGDEGACRIISKLRWNNCRIEVMWADAEEPQRFEEYSSGTFVVGGKDQYGFPMIDFGRMRD